MKSLLRLGFLSAILAVQLPICLASPIERIPKSGMTLDEASRLEAIQSPAAAAIVAGEDVNVYHHDSPSQDLAGFVLLIFLILFLLAAAGASAA